MTPSRWHPFAYPLKFHLGEFTLARVGIPVQRRVFTLDEIRAEASAEPFPALSAMQQGFLLSNVPQSASTAARAAAAGEGWLVHPIKRYERCYIRMDTDFEGYKAKFSSKSRSGINRKVKRFSEEAGALDMRVYRSPEELATFFDLAGPVSAASYQERLLDCGLPRDAATRAQAQQAAARDEMRAFLLFAAGKPVSYLYCPARAGVLEYAFLGYIPEFAKLSPGTVLQWLALEHLFAENRYSAFDFTEGDSDHKRFFSTHQVPCALELYLRPSLRNRSLMGLHAASGRAVAAAVGAMDRLGIKNQVKRWIRRSA